MAKWRPPVLYGVGVLEYYSITGRHEFEHFHQSRLCTNNF
jgi:hypothetical protein